VMAESPETSPLRGRFQFGLRSLLIVMTVWAMWLGLATWSPGAAVMVAIVAVYLFAVFVVRWLSKDGVTRLRLGCLASGLSILAAFIMVGAAPERSREWYGCAVLLGLYGLAGLINCFCVAVPVLAKREEQLLRLEQKTTEQHDGPAEDPPARGGGCD
jgi:hypothetical protein